MWVDGHYLLPGVWIRPTAAATVVYAGGVLPRPVCIRGGVRAVKRVRQIVEAIEPVQMGIGTHATHS